MSDTNDEIFILTTDTIQGYEGEIVRFPEPVSACRKSSKVPVAVCNANKDLRDKARELGANVVLGVRYQCDWISSAWYVRAAGTPVFLDQTLQDPQEFIENLKDSRDLREL